MNRTLQQLLRGKYDLRIQNKMGDILYFEPVFCVWHVIEHGSENEKIFEMEGNAVEEFYRITEQNFLK
jgi:hypothetical protein